MDPLTKIRLQSQMAQMKKVSEDCVEYLKWLKENVSLPDQEGAESNFENVIQHQINMVSYFSSVQKSLKGNKNMNKKKSLPMR